MGVSNLQLSQHVCGWDYRKSGRQAGRQASRQAGRQAARVQAVQDEAMRRDGMRCGAVLDGCAVACGASRSARKNHK